MPPTDAYLEEVSSQLPAEQLGLLIEQVIEVAKARSEAQV